jgi:hypothetical protein
MGACSGFPPESFCEPYDLCARVVITDRAEKPQTHASSMVPRTACPACCIPRLQGLAIRTVDRFPGSRAGVLNRNCIDLVGYGSGDSAVCGEAEHINEQWR